MLAIVIPGAIIALLLASWAHMANDRRGLAIALYVALVVVASLNLILGSGILVVGDELAEEGINPSDGWLFIAIGLSILIPMLPPVRQLLSRFMPFNPRSVSDMVGLVVLVTAGVVMYASIDMGAVDTADQEFEFGPSALVWQAVLLLGIAYFGIGGAITRDLLSVRERLGLFMPTARQVVISLAMIIPLFFVSAMAGLLTEMFQPGLADQAQDFVGEIRGDMDVLTAALLIGITAGIGEEILFRGAIQPRYGLIFTSIIFALIHVQYGLSFVMLGVFLTSIVLGIQRMKMNTTCCIITHAAYNFTAVMIAMSV